jgi:UDP-GlcNAc:undecaprenyl-phosphate GlcNAc-1-phosphate transferase
MTYKTYLAMLFVSALGAFWFTPFAAWLARRWGAVDLPNARKVHRRPMPRLGGVAVYLGFLLPWAGLYFLHNPVAAEFRNYDTLFLSLVLGATAMLGLGIYDDIKGANASKKFIVQFIVAFGLWMCGHRIEALQNPFGEPFHLGWFGLPITLLWIVGVTNAINLLDGIDGLVAGVTACMAITLAVINALTGHVVVALLSVALAGACLGFLPHNHSPARIFLGDSGSLTIGLVLACIGIISLFQQSEHAASPLLSVPIILFGLPIFDTARVMYQRWRRGVSLFHPDKTHVHHRLLSLGLDHRQAAWVLYGVAFVTGLVAIMLSLMPTDDQLKLSLLFAVLSIGVALLWKIRLKAKFEKDEDNDGE